MSTPRIRGGRGRITGPDSRVLRARDIESRARISKEETGVDQLYIGPWGAYGGDITDNSGYGQELRLAILPQVMSKISLSHARLRITNTRVGFICCSLYRYDVSGKNRGSLRKVAGTDALFQGTGSAGVQTVELQSKSFNASIVPSSTYFLGAYVSNNAIQLASYANTDSRVIAVNSYPMSESNKTPGSVPVKGLAKQYSRYIPWIVYLSKTGNQLL